MYVTDSANFLWTFVLYSLVSYIILKKASKMPAFSTASMYILIVSKGSTGYDIENIKITWY